MKTQSHGAELELGLGGDQKGTTAQPVHIPQPGFY